MLLSGEQQKWVMDWLKRHKINHCPVCGQQTFRIGNAIFERPEDRPKVQIYCTACGNVLFFDAGLVFELHDLVLNWNNETNQMDLDNPQEIKRRLEQPEIEDFNPS
jgi:hypothetical protein